MPDPDPAFLAFGRVTAHIAACEQIMRLALGAREVERAQRNGNAGPERFQQYIDRMLTWDFGQLSQRVRTQLKLPDDPWLQIFKDAKDLRNTVAHDFWSPYYALLQTDEGIEIIARHCAVLERHFAHLAKGLIVTTGVDMDIYLSLISSENWKEETREGFDAKIRHAENVIANMPDWPEAQK